MNEAPKTLDTLKYEFSKIVDEKNPIMLQHRATPENNDVWDNVYYMHPNSTQALTLAKRVEALAKVMPFLAALLQPIVDRLIAKGAEIVVAKASRDQARAAKKAAAAVKKATKETIQTNPFHGLNAQVAALLKEVAEPYRLKAIDMDKARHNNILADLKTKANVVGSFNPEMLYPYVKGDRYGNAIIQELRLNARTYIHCVSNMWLVKDNVADIILAKATEFAHNMVVAFVQKVGTKLSGIVDAKGNLVETSISGSLQDHWMHFKFADGSSFSVQSQIVWKTSCHRVHYAQYPTCFRNVTLGDGSKMELPSEKKMRETFAAPTEGVSC